MSKFCMGCMEQYDDNIGICPHCGYKEGTDPVQALHMKPGTILHERYIVGKALGFGGFGVTYIGWDALLENKIAIKEFLPSEFSTRMPGVSYVTVYSGDKYKQFNTGLDRFIEEAKKLAQLNNVENIVTIYDCFKENNTAYIIMEYLEGETIAERLKRDKKIPHEEAVGMLIPIIDALAIVHEHDILHRDIAPDNIFVTKDNKIKLLDFGAARYATTSHSRSLTVIIKPGYSPEEQYRSNGDQGTYTDVYAVAATLYKMITGNTPSDALERRANIESKNKDPLKPLVQYCSDIDENTENAILNAMNVRIEDRTSTMAAFKEELTSIDPVKRVAGKIRKIDLLRWPLWAKIAIPVLSALILVTGILFATGIIGFSSGPNENIEIADGMTRVPSLINGTVSDADERLKDAVLIYIISGKEYSDDIPADYVLTQNKSAGSIVVQNSVVLITVSGGDSDVIEKDFMADLTYRTEEKAKEILKTQGFTPEITYTTSETVGAGLVISQNIEHGARIKTGDIIRLVVSIGQPSFAMPNVTGKSESNAKNILSEKGLACVVKYVYNNKVQKGTVISQSISANTLVKKGTNVVLSISNGLESVSGTCGENLTWIIRDGVLTISGKGSLTGTDTPPWNEHLREIEKIIFDSGVERVGGVPVFSGYDILKEVVISDTVTTISENAFVNSPIQKYTVSENNSFYTSIDGVLFSKDKKSLWRYPRGKADVSYMIPSGTVILEGMAFWGAKVKEVVIPDTVKKIESTAFNYCTSITDLKIPPTVISVNEHAFGFWSEKQTIYVEGRSSKPEQWVSAWNENCSAKIVWDTSSLPKESGTCGENLIWTLKDGVLIISGKGEMYDYNQIGIGTLYYDTPWEPFNQNIKEIILEEGVVSIGSGAFSNLVHLEKIHCPDTVQVIGESAFFRCFDLCDISLSANLQKIGYYAFGACSNLHSITIPKAIQKVDKCAFVGWEETQTICIEGENFTKYWDFEWNADCDAKIVWDP